MKKSTVVSIIVIILIILGVYWYLHQGSSTYTDNSTATSTGSSNILPAQTVVLDLGTASSSAQYLTAASNDMTLYTYAKDTVGVSNCSGACETAWPPYTVSSPSNISAMSGISGTVGTITRTDGTYQVTYNGMPLYFYTNDMNPGDETGANIDPNWSVAMP